MSSTFPTLRERLAEAQKTLGLTGSQLALELRITPEWLSKIARGHVQGSADLGLRLDAFLQSRQIEARSISEVEAASIRLEERAAYDSAASLEAEIREHFQTLLAAAANDPARLGWVLEQMREHLAAPAHWRSGVRLGRINPVSEKAQSRPSPSHQSRSA